MLGSLVNGLDSFFIWLSSTLKQNFSDYCDLETAQDQTTLVAKDGSLLSIVRINGIKNIIGSKTFQNNIVGPFSSGLQPSMEKRGHQIQFWFMVDPDRTEQEIRNMLRPAYETAENLDLDLSEMLDERVRNLSGWTAVEENYAVLWTRPSVLVKSELNQEKKRRHKTLMASTTPIANGQNPNAAVSMLQDRHAAFVDSVVSEMSRAFMDVKLLNAYDAVRQVRKSVDEGFTDVNWQPHLPGDHINPTIRRTTGKSDEWDIVWPKLSWQVCPRDAKIIGDNIVRVGDKIFAPIYIDLMPKELRPFDDLFHRLMNKRDLPWRVSFTIEGDGLAAVATKALVASVLGFASSDNKLLNGAVQGLRDRAMNNETIVKFRISLCTWAPAGKEDELSRRLSDLARGVESWGSCLVSEVTGDPIAGVMSSALGVTANSIATISAAPLEEATYMLPLTRPCSPWETGAVLFRSPDGKLMPYQPGSSQQTTWVSLIFAKPGSGKSVLMNMTNLALCLAPGLQRLPRIGIIDIGPSSSGLISLIKEALPPAKRHYAECYRIRMTEEYSVNPFDTQLGCRFPTSAEKTFLINFLTLLATDPSEQSPEKGMDGLVSMVVDDMYLRLADKNQAKKYDTNVEFLIDDAIKETGLVRDNKTTWWEVVDHLFTHNRIREAMIAQRHAVPLLSDATSSAQDEKIRTIYEKVIVSTGETLVGSFNRLIAEALNRYRILARPTIFDLGEARVVSLDLDEVAKTGGVGADRQTAVMYMLARYLLAKDFHLIPEVLNEMPYPAHIEPPSTIPVLKYKQHHRKRIEDIRDDLKRICFDEFHRTAKSQMVREQVLVDMREGRKWNVDVTLASQTLEDFDSVMREFATSIFIMDGGNAQAIENIAKTFGVSDEAEKDALMNRVHGPRKGGGTFLAKFSTNQGWYTQLLTSTLGPVELWAFSTTSEDASIRNRLYTQVGQSRARKILAIAYPGGSAKKEIEFRKEQQKSKGMLSDDDGSNLYDQIVRELIEKYRHIN